MKDLVEALRFAAIVNAAIPVDQQAEVLADDVMRRHRQSTRTRKLERRK